MMDIDRAIVEGPMGGDIGQMREFGSAIAKHDLPLLYKVLFKVGSPAFIVKRLNIVGKQYIRESDDRAGDAAATARRWSRSAGAASPCTSAPTASAAGSTPRSSCRAPRRRRSSTRAACTSGDAAARWRLRWR